MLHELSQVLQAVRAEILESAPVAFLGRGVPLFARLCSSELCQLLLFQLRPELGPLFLADVVLKQFALLLSIGFDDRYVLKVADCILGFSCLRCQRDGLRVRFVNVLAAAHGGPHLPRRILVMFTGIHASSMQVDHVHVLNIDQARTTFIHGRLRLDVIVFEQWLLVLARRLSAKITHSCIEVAGLDVVLFHV